MSNSNIIRREASPDSGIFSRNQSAFDSDGGMELAGVRPGTVLEVQTKNTAYTVIPQEGGDLLIWGHSHYCPEPVKIGGIGSCYATGVVRKAYLGVGMRLNFRIADHNITTSRILKIQFKPSN
jgi:hypothetical protein